MIAPNQCHMIDCHPNDPFPELSLNNAVLLFPSPISKPISEMNVDSIQHLIVVDGTWKQAKSLIHWVTSNADIPHVRITSQQTLFWRYQP
jgi:DTW domain-containing protein YfiP